MKTLTFAIVAGVWELTTLVVKAAVWAISAPLTILLVADTVENLKDYYSS